MITGIVVDDQAWIRLKVGGPKGNVRSIKALVDTGYTGWLTLPAAIVEELGLLWQDAVAGTLADGSLVVLDVYEATVIWNQRPRQIRVDQADAVPLIGMALMQGYELNVKVRSRGKVTLKPLR
jgi:clan AA aspartic protease